VVKVLYRLAGDAFSQHGRAQQIWQRRQTINLMQDANVAVAEIGQRRFGINFIALRGDQDVLAHGLSFFILSMGSL
jgi:hypothetical protein